MGKSYTEQRDAWRAEKGLPPIQSTPAPSGGGEPKPSTPAPAPSPTPKPPTPTPAPDKTEPTKGLTSTERGFTPDPSWSVVEKSAQGTPTVYEDKEGVRHYSPESTMWGMGFQTGGKRVEGRGMVYDTGPTVQGQYRGGSTSEVPYVAVATPTGVKHITQLEAERLSRLTGEARHSELQNMGIIAKAQKYVPPAQQKAQEASKQAASYLRNKGLMDTAGKVSSNAFGKANNNSEIRQALYDVGFSGKEVKEGMAEVKAAAKATAAFELELRNMPTELQSAYKKGGYEAYEREYTKYIKDFEADHTNLADGQYVNTKEFRELPSKYQIIGLKKGFDAMTTQIEADVKAQNKAIDTMEKYKTDKGYNLLLAIDKGVKPETMKLAGFEDKDIKWAKDSKKAAVKTGVALTGEKQWQHIGTGRIITEKEFKAIRNTSEADYYHLTDASARRMVITGASTLFFSPARVALPEVTKADIKPVEYAIGSAQLATWALPIAPKGVIPLASLGISGTFGYNLATNWKELGAGGKAMGAAVVVMTGVPVIGSVAKTAIPVAIKVATASGEATIWKGIAVGGKPIIGISSKSATIGTKGVKYPEFASIKAGYEPVTKIETSIMGTRQALQKMGVSAEDIAKVENTLGARGMFAGKKSPYLTKTIESEPIKSLSREGVGEVLSFSVKQKGKVDKVYGSYTMKPQLDPKLKAWRGLGDIDIQTSLPEAETAEFTKRLANILKRTEGSKNVKISEQSPTLIETKASDGKWHHAVDIHSKDVMPGSETAPEGAYGLIHAEKGVTVKLPGVCKVKFMALSETGKRKAASILQFQKGEIAPLPHRTKDIVDFYVILRTYKGQKVADEWARAFGQDPAKLLKMAAKNPPKLAAWELSPSAAGKGNPSVSVNIPASYVASLPTSLKASVSSPVSIASLSSPSPYIARSSPAVLASPNIASPRIVSSPPRATVSPSSAKASPSSKPSTSVTPSPGTSKSLIPSKSPKTSKSPMPIPKSPSPASPSPTSPSPSPMPPSKPSSPSPSPASPPPPSPSPTPKKPPPKPRPRSTRSDTKKRKLIESSTSAIAYQRGELQGKDVWHVWYKSKDGKVERTIILGKAPEAATVYDGPKSAKRSIQRLYGPGLGKTIVEDTGAVDTVISPGGEKPSISFRRDVQITSKLPRISGKPPRISPKPPRIS